MILININIVVHNITIIMSTIIVNTNVVSTTIMERLIMTKEESTWSRCGPGEEEVKMST